MGQNFEGADVGTDLIDGHNRYGCKTCGYSYGADVGTDLIDGHWLSSL